MLAPIVSKRTPMRSYLRLLCHEQQRERWRRAGELSGEDESAVVRRLMDEWAEDVLDREKQTIRPPKKK